MPCSVPASASFASCASDSRPLSQLRNSLFFRRCASQKSPPPLPVTVLSMSHDCTVSRHKTVRVNLVNVLHCYERDLSQILTIAFKRARGRGERTLARRRSFPVATTEVVRTRSLDRTASHRGTAISGLTVAHQEMAASGEMTPPRAVSPQHQETAN
jgi:hypothetical protein